MTIPATEEVTQAGCICDRKCPVTEDRHWVNCPAHEHHAAYLAMLSATPPVPDVAIPAGMKPWAGGDSAPDDWDGGPVLLRDGRIYQVTYKPAEKDDIWKHGFDGSETDPLDAIAYTPKPQPPSPQRGGEALRERAVMVCPQCEGEGSYADGLDADACTTYCTRCGGNGWIVDLAALTADKPDITYTDFRDAAHRRFAAGVALPGDHIAFVKHPEPDEQPQLSTFVRGGQALFEDEQDKPDTQGLREAILTTLHQYRNDLTYPVDADSRERRLAMIDALIGKLQS